VKKPKDKPKVRAASRGAAPLSLEQKKAEFIKIIADNGTFNDVAAALGVHRTTPIRWVREDKKGDLRNLYAQAREDQADLSVDEIKDIARKVLSGEIDPQAARVAIDALKWEAGKRKPKVYGDKLELAGDTNAPLIVRLTTHFPEEKK
jgi:transposase